MKNLYQIPLEQIRNEKEILRRKQKNAFPNRIKLDRSKALLYNKEESIAYLVGLLPFQTEKRQKYKTL